MPANQRSRARLPFVLQPLAASLLMLALPVQAATHQVSSELELRNAIDAINLSAGANFIEFKSNITLTGALPPITGTVTIKGNGKTLSGDSDGDGVGDVQLLVVGSNSAPGTSVLVQISGLTLEKGLAQGADGVAGGAGANGTGGALQINSNADVVLKDVKIKDSGAKGGDGDGNGDGGKALGGGIYVAPGGRVSLGGTADPAGDPLNATPNIGAGAVIGGTGQGTGSNGTGAGDGIFLDGSGNLRLSTNPGQVLRIDGGISDTAGDCIAQGGNAATCTPLGTWNILLEGGGGASTDTTDPNADLNYGTIVLGGNNTYGGDTYISDVNVGVTSMGALGSGGVVALDNGGLVVAAGVDIDRELVLASGGGRIGVYNGTGTLSGKVTGTGDLMKVGEGDLELTENSTFDGDWRVRQGALILDKNERLGDPGVNLILDGGGLKFSADVPGVSGVDPLRAFTLTNRGGYIDNQGHTVVLGEKISCWGDVTASGLTNCLGGDTTLTFRDSTGGGTTTLSDSFSYGLLEAMGNTYVESGTVIGNIAQGNLTVDSGAHYQNGGKDRTIGGLLGSGAVDLGANNLNINLNYLITGGTAPTFDGVISGAGELIIRNNDPAALLWNWTGTLTVAGCLAGNCSLTVDTSSFASQGLTGNNTYSGGTTVGKSSLLELTNANSIGTGKLTLNNGALRISGSSFARNLYLQGGVGILESTGDVDFTGQLFGSADFLKQGSGTLTLHGDNTTTFSGKLVVAGAGSYVALADETAAGAGTFILAEGGGLKLLQDTANLRAISIQGGNGVIDTGNFTVTSTGNITGITGLLGSVVTSRLVKEGSGDLIFTSNVNLNGGLEISQGTVQLGNGGTTGSFSSGGGSLLGTPDILINSGAKLIVNRSNNITLNDDINGGGELIKQGAGVLRLGGNNTFSGGLTVLNGYVTGGSDAAYGSGNILLDGGGLLLASDLYRDVILGNGNVAAVTPGGSLQVGGSDRFIFGGQLLGSGDFQKTGSGTLVYTGVANPTGNVTVAEGVFQIGEGYTGTFLSDIKVNSGAQLVFGRDDITQYDYVASGVGDVIKRGTGELILTGDQLFTGDLKIENGTVRLGYGGATGSLAGGAEITTGSELVIDRSGSAEISGSLKGDGVLRQVGTGQLRLPGDSSAFNGNTFIDNGSLRLDGILGGHVNLASGTYLQGLGRILGGLNLQDGSYFAPGNASYGVFHIDGDMQLSSGSEIRMDVDDVGNSDKINVGGAANLAGRLTITAPSAGTYLPGCCNYTLIDAASGVNGTFDQIVNPLAFLNTNVTYTANTVELALTRNGSGMGSLPGLTWNQQQVSSALDAIETVDPLNPIVTLVTALTDAQARDAYNSLSGDSLLAQASAAGSASRRFNHLLSARSSRLGLASRSGKSASVENNLAAVRAGAMPELPAAFANSYNPMNYDGPTSVIEGVWVEANGFRSEEKGDSVVGSAASSLNGNLLALGADGYWSDSTIVGFGFGQFKGDISFGNRTAQADASGGFFGVYSRFESSSGWHYKVSAAMGKQDADQTRTVVVGGTNMKAQSTATVSTLSAELEAGLALHLGSYSMRPFAMLDMQSLKRDAYQETGAGAANLSVAAANNMTGEFGVGIELSRPWLTDGARWAQLQTGVALMIPFGDTQREQSVTFSGTSNSYSVKASAIDTPYLQLSLGAEMYLSRSFAVWGGYEGRVSSAVQEHNGVISLQYRW